MVAEYGRGLVEEVVSPTHFRGIHDQDFGMKNREMTILDELLKLGTISKDKHEKIYIGYLI